MHQRDIRICRNLYRLMATGRANSGAHARGRILRSSPSLAFPFAHPFRLRENSRIIKRA